MDYLQQFRDAFSRKKPELIETACMEALEARPEDTDLFLDVSSRLKGHYPEIRAILLEMLIEEAKASGRYEDALLYYCELADTSADGLDLRKAVASCIHRQYGEGDEVNHFITSAHLTNPSVNLREALLNFDRLVLFKKGDVCIHQTFGPGEIVSVDLPTGTISIDFLKKGRRDMDMRLAEKALQKAQSGTLSYSVIKGRHTIAAEIEKNPSRILTALLEQTNTLHLSELEDIFKGTFIPASRWKDWTDRLNKEAAKSPAILITGRIDKTYEIIRAGGQRMLDVFKDILSEGKPIQQHEKLRVFLKNFLKLTPDEKDTLVQELNSTAQHATPHPVQTAMIAVIAGKLCSHYHLNKELFAGIFDSFTVCLQSVEHWFEAVGASALQREIIMLAKAQAPDWDVLLAPLFKASYKLPLPSLIDQYLPDKKGWVSGQISTLFHKDPAAYSNITLWITKNIWDKQAEPVLGPLRNIDTGLRIIAASAGIEEYKGAYCKENIRDIRKEVLKRGWAMGFIEHLSKSEIEKLITAFMETDWDLIEKKSALIDVVNTYPELAKKLKTTNTENAEESLYTSGWKLREKHKELEFLATVKIPENSADIGTAREHGDLKENAEYKAAKEMQSILMRRAQDLRNQLAHAKVIDLDHVNTDSVGIGTTVILANDSETLRYTILGVWDADPDKNILSYKQPLAAALIGKKRGETIDLSEGNTKGTYTVTDIQAAQQ